MDSLIITVETGRKSTYTFRYASGGGIAVESNGRAYVDFFDKGATAILMLMKDHDRYRQFFEAVRAFAVTNPRTDYLEGFIGVEDVAAEYEEYWELVSTMIEEAEAADQRAAEGAR